MCYDMQGSRGERRRGGGGEKEGRGNGRKLGLFVVRQQELG
jgi:hypothetical protein